MNYAVVQDLVDRFGESELVSLTDPDLQAVNVSRVERAIADAQAFADGFLGVVFALPLTGCVAPAPVPGNPSATALVPPPQLVRIVSDVARYYLHSDLAPEHEVYLRYKAAERELQQIAEGRARLICPWGGQPGQIVSGEAPGEAEVYFGGGRRQITDDSLRGFA